MLGPSVKLGDALGGANPLEDEQLGKSLAWIAMILESWMQSDKLTVRSYLGWLGSLWLSFGSLAQNMMLCFFGRIFGDDGIQCNSMVLKCGPGLPRPFFPQKRLQPIDWLMAAFIEFCMGNGARFVDGVADRRIKQKDKIVLENSKMLLWSLLKE